MRQALNDNPLVQVAVLGVLALVVGFFMLTRVMGSDSGSSEPAATEASVAPGAAPSDAASSPSAATTPASPAPEASATAPSSDASPAAAGAFVAGPGLPAPVVSAYADGRAVVLLVVRRGGIDDEAVRRSVEGMGSLDDTELFVTNAGHVARYSRIASGVNLDRVPALIVLRPRDQTHDIPVASVSYGFRGADSAAQAIHDALYEGPRNLPYYPK